MNGEKQVQNAKTTGAKRTRERKISMLTQWNISVYGQSKRGRWQMKLVAGEILMKLDGWKYLHRGVNWKSSIELKGEALLFPTGIRTVCSWICICVFRDSKGLSLMSQQCLPPEFAKIVKGRGDENKTQEMSILKTLHQHLNYFFLQHCNCSNYPVITYYDVKNIIWFVSLSVMILFIFKINT